MSRLATAIVSLALLLTACGGSAVTANAGEDLDVPVGASPTFDGCGSEGDITNYRWTITEAPSDMSYDVGKEIRSASTSCSFTLEAAMLVEEMGEWQIELTVEDDDGNSSSDTVTVKVSG